MFFVAFKLSVSSGKKKPLALLSARVVISLAIILSLTAVHISRVTVWNRNVSAAAAGFHRVSGKKKKSKIIRTLWEAIGARTSHYSGHRRGIIGRGGIFSDDISLRTVPYALTHIAFSLLLQQEPTRDVFKLFGRFRFADAQHLCAIALPPTYATYRFVVNRTRHRRTRHSVTCVSSVIYFSLLWFFFFFFYSYIFLRSSRIFFIRIRRTSKKLSIIRPIYLSGRRCSKTTNIHFLNF